MQNNKHNLNGNGPVYLGVVASHANKHFLEDTAKTLDWQICFVESFDSLENQEHIQGCAVGGGVFVFVDYPMDSASDAQAVVAFAKKIAANPGLYYYVPRPNTRLLVERPSMVGLNPVPDSMVTQIDNGNSGAESPELGTVRVLRSIWRILPRGIRQRNQGLSGFMKRAVSYERKRKPIVSTEAVKEKWDDEATASANLENEDVLPASLQKYGGTWTHLIPSEVAFRHDVVDRMDRFFPAPKGIHVILLNQCNLKCVMCPYHSPKYKTGHTSDYFEDRRAMTDDVMNKVIEYAAENKIVMQLGQIEEPFMHKKLLDYIEQAVSAKVPHIHMTTNGTLLTHEKAERLANSGISSVMFSIDATKPESYRDIRGAELADLEEKIRYFVPLAKKNGIKITVSFILNPTTTSEQENFLSKWRSSGVDSVTYYVLTDHDVATGESIRRSEFYDRDERYPCATPWVQSVVYPDGDVSICCKSMTDVGWRGVISLGNLKEDDYATIWEGDAYKELRNELLENSFAKYDVCTNCEIWSSTSSYTEETSDYVLTYNETVKTYTFK